MKVALDETLIAAYLCASMMMVCGWANRVRADNSARCWVQSAAGSCGYDMRGRVRCVKA